MSLAMCSRIYHCGSFISNGRVFLWKNSLIEGKKKSENIVTKSLIWQHWLPSSSAASHCCWRRSVLWSVEAATPPKKKSIKKKSLRQMNRSAIIKFLQIDDLFMLDFCFSFAGMSASLVLLHCGASVCLLLWAGMVCQARWGGVHQVPDGKVASHLGSPKPADFSQGPAVCNDGPHRRGEVKYFAQRR